MTAGGNNILHISLSPAYSYTMLAPSPARITTPPRHTCQRHLLCAATVLHSSSTSYPLLRHHLMATERRLYRVLPTCRLPLTTLHSCAVARDGFIARFCRSCRTAQTAPGRGGGAGRIIFSLPFASARIPRMPHVTFATRARLVDMYYSAHRRHAGGCVGGITPRERGVALFSTILNLPHTTALIAYARSIY